MKKHEYISSLEPTDYLLIQQASAGDAAAFDRLVERYQSVLHRFVGTYVGMDEIDDVVQFVWLQCFRSLVHLRENQQNEWKGLHTSLKSWLFRVAANRCIDEIRKKKRQRIFFFSDLEIMSEDEDVSILSMLEDADVQPDEYVEQHELRGQLYSAMQRLPEKYRVIIWLRYAKALNYNEIGLRLRMPANTVKTYYYRGCLKLRTILATSYDVVA